MAVLAHPCGTKNDSTPRENDWTKPAAMAIPKEGFFKKEDGRYSPIFPRSPACYGFTIIAKIIPGREPVFYEYSKKLEKAVSELPDSGYSQVPLPAMGALSYQRRNYFMYQGISTRTSTSTPRMQSICSGRWASAPFLKTSKAFPKTGRQTRRPSSKFVRDHQCPGFLEYGEYPFVSAEEIKKALKLKAAFSTMLDQMQ